MKRDDRVSILGGETTMAGRYWVAAGALLAAVAVAAGAVGTHVLKEIYKLPEAQLQTFEIAVRYQMYHALGLVAVGLVAMRCPSRLVRAAGWAFLAGTVLFSGGLYAWLWTGQTPLVQVVPLGGLAWIVGWLLLGCGALRGTECADRPMPGA
jgi:uncharacterized membrane protein YgdD (TMEM256/DUF423 family)